MALNYCTEIWRIFGTYFLLSVGKYFLLKIKSCLKLFSDLESYQFLFISEYEHFCLCASSQFFEAVVLFTTHLF